VVTGFFILLFKPKKFSPSEQTLVFRLLTQFCQADTDSPRSGNSLHPLFVQSIKNWNLQETCTTGTSQDLRVLPLHIF